jgi:hypothetical protein
MPHPSTVCLWLAKYPDFREQYRLAMEQRAYVVLRGGKQMVEAAVPIFSKK